MREKLIYYKQYYNTYIYVIHVITQKQLLLACLYQILGTAKQKKTLDVKCNSQYDNNYMYN